MAISPLIGNSPLLLGQLPRSTSHLDARCSWSSGPAIQPRNGLRGRPGTTPSFPRPVRPDPAKRTAREIRVATRRRRRGSCCRLQWCRSPSGVLSVRDLVAPPADSLVAGLAFGLSLGLLLGLQRRRLAARGSRGSLQSELALSLGREHLRPRRRPRPRRGGG